jgi:acetamidase/formamidase
MSEVIVVGGDTATGCHHDVWDNSLEPATEVVSGAVLEVRCREPAGGHFTPNSTIDAARSLDNSAGHCLTGPIAVRGALPGDTLAVEILGLRDEGWAWTAVLPGFGVLQEEFGDEYGLRIWRVERGDAIMKPGVRVPIHPFCGVMGVAPAEPGSYSTMPPRDYGGNLDCKHLGVGATAYFPVLVPGAMFSIGDGHLGQGDGEVCGTALEAPLTVTIRLTLISGSAISRVRFITTRSATAKVERGGFYGTSAAGEPLELLVRQAVLDMVELLARNHDVTRMDAYMLCSTAGDLKIAVPKLGAGHTGLVTFHLPRCVFVDDGRDD